MLDVLDFVTAVDRIADRLRSLPQSRLRAGAAAAGLALARELSARAQRLEAPERMPYEICGGGEFAVGDQVAVAGRDLAEALRAAGDAEGLAEALAVVRDVRL